MQLALIQMSMQPEAAPNLEKAERMLREAAKEGAQLVLLPELFAGWYFCQTQREEHFVQAHAVDGHPFLGRFQELSRALQLVLPISFFERSGQAHFNSLALYDRGELLGVYRKTHIPDGPGYQEKYYFNPGDRPLTPFQTGLGPIGAAVCWDQWYPEVARCLVLGGAELLLYPTAIGTEPAEAGQLDTSAMWQRAMVGHAVCNACYLGAANRVGQEGDAQFYGRSFICDYRGEILAQAGSEETILSADVHFADSRSFRAGMGFFRDRRPQLYGRLLDL